MKNSLKIASVLIISILFVVSCTKDETITQTDFQIETDVNLNDYSIWGEIISTIFKKEEAQSFYLNALKNGWKDELSIPLAMLVTSHETNFVSYFEEVVDELNHNLSIGDLMYFLNQNPNLALSLYYPDVRSLDEIEIFDNDFKVAVIPNYDAEEYDFYKNGALVLRENSNLDPDFMVLVLQKQEGFIAFSENGTAEDFNLVSAIPYCTGLATQFSSYNKNMNINNLEVTIQGVNYPNPLHKIFILKDKDIINGYNKKCGIQNLTNDDRITSNGSRMMCERDNLNAPENVERVKFPQGKTTRNEFCSWTQSHCKLKVNAFIPTLANSAGTQPFSVTNLQKYVYSWRKGLDAKNWVWTNLDITKWYHLEGQHGDKWVYHWTGINKKTGTTQTTSYSMPTSNSFKDPATGQTTTYGNTVTYSVTKTNKDSDLGNDLVNYCDLCSANGWQGTTYTSGAMNFSVREGGN
jgi:hypothetical protein